MFVSDKLLGLFDIAKETVDDLRTQVAKLAATIAILERELTSTKITNDWLRMKVNQLEYANGALMKKAYNVEIPVPELGRRQPTAAHEFGDKDFTFDDVGEEAARKLGLPVYDDTKQ